MPPTYNRWIFLCGYFPARTDATVSLIMPVLSDASLSGCKTPFTEKSDYLLQFSTCKDIPKRTMAFLLALDPARSI